MRYLAIILGGALYAGGFYVFVKSANITMGGITGLVNVINMIHPVPIGVVTMCINIPLLLISLFVLKWRFTLNTLLGTAISSMFISLCEMILDPFMPVTDNILIAAILGGLTTGTGLGILMKNQSSTGGLDIVVKLMHLKWQSFSGGTLKIILNGTILLFFMIVTRDFDATIYATITMIASSAAFDLVLYGISRVKTVCVITRCADDIIAYVHDKTNNAYTVNIADSDLQAVLLVVQNTAFPAVKNTIHSVDPSAVVIVTKPTGVYGQGFSTFKDALE